MWIALGVGRSWSWSCASTTAAGAAGTALLVLGVVPAARARARARARRQRQRLARGGSASGSLRFQPSELAKLAVLLFVADLLARRADRMVDNWRVTLRPVLVVVRWFAVLIMLQPNLGTTIVLGARSCSPCCSSAGVAAASPGRLLGRRARRCATLCSPSPSPTAGPGCSAFLDPCADPQQHRLPDARSRWSASAAGGLTGRRARRRAGPSGASCPTPTPTSSSPSSARSSAWSARCSSWPVRRRSACSASRAALRAPDRSARCSPPASRRGSWSRPFVNIGAVVGVLPVTGVPAAVRVLRRLVAGDHHGRRRHPPQRRPSERPRRPEPAARPRAGAVRIGTRRVGIRAEVAPPAARAATSCRAGRRRGAGGTGHDPGAPSTSSAAGGRRGHRRARGRLPLTLLPGRGIQRRLTGPNLTAAAGLAAGVGPGPPACAPGAAARSSLATGGYASRAVRARPPACCRVPARAWPSRTPCRRGQPPGRPVRPGRWPCRSRAPPAPALRRPPDRPRRARPRGCRVTGNPVRPEILAVDRATASGRRPGPAWVAPRAQRRAASTAARSARGGSTRPVAGPASGGATGTTSPSATSSATRDWDLLGRRRAPRDGRGPRLPAGALRGRHARSASPRPTWSCAGRAAPPWPSWPRSGLPAVLVPLPVAPGDHQTANAARAGRGRRGGAGARRRARRRPPRAELDAAARRRPAAGTHGRAAAASVGADAADAVADLVGRPHVTPGVTRRRGRCTPSTSGRPWRTHATAVGRRRPDPPAHPRRRRRRRRHERDRHGARRHGPQVTGSDLKAVGRPRAAARRSASTSPSATTRPTCARDADVVAVSTAIPDRNPEVARPPSAGHPGAAPGRDRSPPSPPPAARVAVAGTHGKTTTSSMLALILVEAGLRPVVHHRRRGQRDRHRRGRGTTGEWLVVEADESDGTFLELRAEVAIVTNVEPDHLDHYGGFDAAARRLRPLRRRRARPARGRAPTTPSARRPRPPPPARVDLRRTPPDADYRMRRRRRWPGRRRRSTWCSGGERARRGRAARARGLHNAAQRRAAAGRSALRARRAVRGRRRPRWPASPAWPAASQFRGERDGVTFVDDYAHLPDRGRAPRWPRPRDGGWRRVVVRVPAPPLQPHRGPVARLRRRLRRRRPARASPTCTRRARRRARGDGQARRRRRARRAIPRRRWRTCPRRADLAPTCGRALRPGDLCLTLGAGDLTSLPDEVLAGAAP